MSRTTTSSSSSHRVGAAALRWVLLLLLWQALVGDGFEVASFLFGGTSAAVATWISLLLLPPCAGASLPGTARLALRLVRQTFKSGIEVAGMAFGPPGRLRTGMVPYRSSTPPGTLRDALTALTSLVPGTLPVGEDREGRILYHCLDVDQPVGDQLRADERALRSAFAAGCESMAPAADHMRTPGAPRRAAQGETPGPERRA